VIAAINDQWVEWVNYYQIPSSINHYEWLGCAQCNWLYIIVPINHIDQLPLILSMPLQWIRLN